MPDFKQWKDLVAHGFKKVRNLKSALLSLLKRIRLLEKVSVAKMRMMNILIYWQIHRLSFRLFDLLTFMGQNELHN